jgi:hypothetical protein
MIGWETRDGWRTLTACASIPVAVQMKAEFVRSLMLKMLKEKMERDEERDADEVMGN